MGKTAITLALILFGASCQLAAAPTWYVDDSVAASGDGTSWQTAFKKVQEGIDAASHGDTVIFAEGLYVENVKFNGKNVIVTSTDPLNSSVVKSTIIDGGRNGCVVELAGTEDETSVISGFTIRGGKAEYGGGICGGSDSSAARTTIENNIIAGNSADFGGGLAHCAGLIRNNIIMDNSALFAGRYLGGGGLLRCNGTIENNIVVLNSAWCGGGLFECEGTIQNNIICDNSADYGGGLYRCQGTIQNNSVSRNSAWHGGGGIYCCDGLVRNNVVAGNSADFGGGLFWCRGIIRNNTICGNSAYCRGGIYGIGGSVGNCIIWGNKGQGEAQITPGSPVSYCCIQDWTGGGIGNISEDPRFAAGYRLSPESPCIDAGKNEDWMSQALDPDGNPRILLGASSATVDMGAFEYAPQGPPSRTWYVNASASGSGDGTSWEASFKTIQKGIDAASHGDTVIVAQGVYLENVAFNGKNVALRSTDPTDSEVVARTIIDGSQAGSVVTFLGTEDETCVLAGFTIQNGGGKDQGGICGGISECHSRATIRNNLVCANSGKGITCCDGLIENNIITGNSASGLAYCDGLVQNNTIYANTAEKGGGLYACRAIIRNCIIWGNVTEGQVWGYTTPTYSCIERWEGPGDGNFSYFPYFVAPDEGDYHLQSWSPCIDAGDPNSPFSREPEPNGGRIDIGAYGNTPEATSASPDSDRDELPDDWETRFFGDLAQRADGDPDGDAMSNLEEYRWGFNPLGPAALWHVDGSLPVSGDGKTWQTAFTTIQEGIDAASEREIVIVAEGAYNENIRLRGRDIVLTSTDPLDPYVVANTIIDGSGDGPVVTFFGKERAACILTGFTIVNGKAEYGGGICGGTYIHRTRATIEHNVITENEASGSGGAIAFCDGNIRYNRVYYNSARDAGGGLCRCGGVIQHNAIRWNSAQSGGGLYGCDGAIQNNIIAANSADSGGALKECDGTIQNNTITQNLADWGAGLSWCSGTILNCIIWGNVPRGGGQIDSSCQPTYSCIEDWTGGGEGNIAFNPHFVYPEIGDLHLEPWSPCIDAGDPASPFSNEPEPNGGRINMGAYGNTPEATSKPMDSDTDADGLPDAWELHWFENLEQAGTGDVDGDRITNVMEYCYGWDPKTASRTVVENLTKNRCYQTIQTALCESNDGDEIVVYPGLYVENIRFRGKNVIFRSTDPSNASVVSSTIIDGGRNASVISFSGTEDDSCILSGFTIQNGRAAYGGGINGGDWHSRTHATIENNIIRRNTLLDEWGEGGGICYCDGNIRRNVISDNSARFGGGLYACSGEIENNTITGNVAIEGGGLNYCDGVIRCNIISGNVAEGDDAKGGGLASCSGVIENNVISGNSATGSFPEGGGLFSCNGTITNNTIVSNSAWGAYHSRGGGLGCCEGAILNCIIWGNTAPEGAQIHSSSEPAYCCIEGWTGGAGGNIAQDPTFIDRDGPDGDSKTFLDNNYRLAAESPCIDTGCNEDWMWGALDLDGNPRIFFGKTSRTADMGAYEYGSWPFKVIEVSPIPTGEVRLTWKSRPGDTYTVWSCPDLPTAEWTEEITVPSTGDSTIWIGHPVISPQNFYRIEVAR